MIEIDLLTSVRQYKNNLLLEYDSGYYEGIKDTVLNRDDYTCQCCRFRAKEYQSILALHGNIRDLDNLITVCIFCQQCFQLHKIDQISSGVLIWLPEFTQVELNRLSRVLFVSAYARRDEYRKSEFFVNKLLEREKMCAAKVGIGKPKELLQKLRDNAFDQDLLDHVKSIRLLPTQKRILKQGLSEYNQFPQIIASWQMEKTLEKEDLSLLNKLDELFYTEEEFESYLLEKNKGTKKVKHKSQETASQKPTIAEIASKLLVDAATFFITLAKQNKEIEQEMKENATVFQQMADLLKKEPLGVIEGKSHSELASRLLGDAAEFFDTLAEQNEPIREKMKQNAQAFRDVAVLVEKDPLRSYIQDISQSKITEWASKLLLHIATLFEVFANQNIEIDQEMREYARVFEQMANLLESKPHAFMGKKTHRELAVILLTNASEFFNMLAKHNKSIRDQMKENAFVCVRIADLLQNDPQGYL